MSATDSTQKDGHSGSTMIAAVLAFVLILYFVFPMVLLYPLRIIYGKGGTPPRVLKAVAITSWPIDQLAKKYPPYRECLYKEAELLGFFK